MIWIKFWCEKEKKDEKCYEMSKKKNETTKLTAKNIKWNEKVPGQVPIAFHAWLLSLSLSFFFLLTYSLFLILHFWIFFFYPPFLFSFWMICLYILLSLSIHTLLGRTRLVYYTKKYIYICRVELCMIVYILSLLFSIFVISCSILKCNLTSNT